MEYKNPIKKDVPNLPPSGGKRVKGDPMKIDINDKLRDLIPPQTEAETAEFERKLLAEGCRDPLIVWGSIATLIDGHHRLSICQKHGIPFDVIEVEFESFEEAKNWIIENQLGRRNLTPEAVSYLRGMRYNVEKQAHGGDRTSEEATGNDSHLPTDERLAAAYMVNAKTIRNDADFATDLDTVTKNCGQEFRTKLLGRNLRVTRQQLKQLVKLSLAEQRATVKEVIKSGKMPQEPAAGKDQPKPAKTTKPKGEISVPAEPTGLAAALLELRGRSYLLKVQKALAKLLEEETESKE